MLLRRSIIVSYLWLILLTLDRRVRPFIVLIFVICIPSALLYICSYCWCVQLCGAFFSLYCIFGQYSNIRTDELRACQLRNTFRSPFIHVLHFERPKGSIKCSFLRFTPLFLPTFANYC